MGRDPRASEGYATFKNGRPDILRRLCLIVAVAAFAPGCGSTPLTPSPAPLHLYVVNAAQPSGVLQFNLPLTTTTTPNFLMAWNSPGAVPDSDLCFRPVLTDGQEPVVMRSRGGHCPVA